MSHFTPAPDLTVISATDWAYIAGIVDGEGTIAFYTRNVPGYPVGRYLTPYVTVANTDRGLIEWLSQTLGGKSYAQKERRQGWKPSWKWFRAGHHAREIIRYVHPFLRVKRRQAEVTLRIPTDSRRGSRRLTEAECAERQLAIQEIRVLNRRGSS